MSAFPFLYYIVNPPSTPSTGFVFKPQLSMAQDGVHDAHGNQPGIWNCVLAFNQRSSLAFPRSPWMTLRMSDSSKCPLKGQGTAWWTCLAPRTWNLAVAQVLGLANRIATNDRSLIFIGFWDSKPLPSIFLPVTSARFARSVDLAWKSEHLVLHSKLCRHLT
jgi:hypothetical protein